MLLTVARGPNDVARIRSRHAADRDRVICAAARSDGRRYVAEPMDLVVRAERLDDPAGARLVAAFSEEIAALYPAWDPDVGPSAHPDEFVPPRGRFLVARRAGQPVGCGGVKRLDDTVGEIKRLYVVPDERGRGVGRLLVGALEQAARELGLRAVRLDTGDQQPDALGLFGSTGYREIPDYNANPYASFWFEKSLV